MQYYKRHIGDYHKKAGRLSLLQHGVYMILMDAIYDREQFPTKEEAIDWCWASTPEELTAVDFVLSKFFTNGDGIYTQKRMDEEIEDYKDFCTLQKEKGKKGGRPKANGLIKKPDGFENKPNETRSKPDETLTTNHYPLTTNHKKNGRFAPPTQQEVQEYWQETNLSGTAEEFHDHFSSNGWKVSGKAPMKDWKASARNWSKREIRYETDRQGKRESNHGRVMRELQEGLEGS